VPTTAATNSTPLVFYIHADHLNTARVITSNRLNTAAPGTPQNNIRWSWLPGNTATTPNTTSVNTSAGDPFGATPANANPSALATGNFTFNLRFAGQYFDKESGLHYNHHRDYDPTLGRYVQSDPIGLEGGINTYLYVGADPLSFIDLEGLEAMGHHWVIGPIRNNANLSPDARRVFHDARTGYYGERHGWDKPHAEYNRGVQDLWDSKKFDPKTMTKDQADSFVRDVMRSRDRRISDYRRMIINKCVQYGMRRPSGSRGGLE
jgi:RHS repeat-associated protein